jgi:hypothetical protein
LWSPAPFTSNKLHYFPYYSHVFCLDSSMPEHKNLMSSDQKSQGQQSQYLSCLADKVTVAVYTGLRSSCWCRSAQHWVKCDSHSSSPFFVMSFSR